MQHKMNNTLNKQDNVDNKNPGQSPTSYRDKREQIQKLQSLPLSDKIAYSCQIIDRILNEHRKPVIAWSGGKDSTVLLNLILKKRPKIEVVWVNTGVEFPECARFIQQLAHDWEINLYVVKPRMNFWKVVDKYGYPFFGKGNGSGYWYNRVNLWKRKGRKEIARKIEIAKASNECCRILKENPAKKLYRELNVDCVVLGNIVSESHQRFLNWYKKGDYFYSNSESRWKAWPLSIWTDKDIWEYHKLNSLPYSPIYDKGHRRNGCWPCLMDIKFKDNHLSTLRQTHPKLWKFLVERKGVGEVILSLKLGLSREEMDEQYEGLRKRVHHLIQQRPCFFDTV